MTKNEIIRQTLDIQEASIKDAVDCLCNAKLYKVFISNNGCPQKIIQWAKGADSEKEVEKQSLVKCIEHLYNLNPKLILWVWENEKSCLVME